MHIDKHARQDAAIKKAKLIKTLVWVLILFGIAGLIYANFSPGDPNNPTVSRRGIHQHAKLSIVIDGVDQPIPAGIGLMAGMEHPNRMHTHEADQEIHMEMQGRVTQNDLKLKNFFEVWGKVFTDTQILDAKLVEGKSITMTVNDKPNTQLGEYVMADGDNIRIEYK